MHLTTYTLVLHLHVSAVVLSGSLFILRALLRIADNPLVLGTLALKRA